MDPAAVFSHFVMRRTGTRDISQVTFTTRGGADIVALCNHWPSRSGGTYESRGYRMTAGETLSYRHPRIWEARGRDIPIIAMGDFNDDPFDDSVQAYARATRERADVQRAQTAVRFYNPARRHIEQTVQDHCAGYGPIRFGLPNGAADRNVNTSGFSDHFPVSMVLVEKS